MLDYVVFIGRFQPFHMGHWKVLKKALSISNKVIICIGSANRPRSAKNPFTFYERTCIIDTTLTKEERARIVMVPIDDSLYNENKWITGVQSVVRGVAHTDWVAGPIKIGIIGHHKDETSYYLKQFPQWESHDFTSDFIINATDIRRDFYEDRAINMSSFITQKHLDVTRALFAKVKLAGIFEEYRVLKEYRIANGVDPNYAGDYATAYRPIFNTVDALVTQSGHVLVVVRGSQPGVGLYALPGGFLEQKETIRDGIIRELKEETQIGVRHQKLVGCLHKDLRIFDHPDRSQRGRTITTVGHIELPDDDKLPTIKGSDDATGARWMSLDEIKKKQEMFFEDHYDIIEAITGA